MAAILFFRLLGNLDCKLSGDCCDVLEHIFIVLAIYDEFYFWILSFLVFHCFKHQHVHVILCKSAPVNALCSTNTVVSFYVILQLQIDAFLDRPNIKAGLDTTHMAGNKVSTELLIQSNLFVLASWSLVKTNKLRSHQLKLKINDLYSFWLFWIFSWKKIFKTF
jgi:hypothetical protein